MEKYLKFAHSNYLKNIVVLPCSTCAALIQGTLSNEQIMPTNVSAFNTAHHATVLYWDGA